MAIEKLCSSSAEPFLGKICSINELVLVLVFRASLPVTLEMDGSAIVLLPFECSVELELSTFPMILVKLVIAMVVMLR